MTESAPATSPSDSQPRTGVLAWSRANRHFLLAAAILVLAGAGWNAMVAAIGIVTLKEPVPWPAGVEVDEGFRTTSLPEAFGPYQFVSQDGELDVDRKGDPVRDGKPDGLAVITKDTMELLGIGTYADEQNLPGRKSNWYSIRTYRDSRLPPSHPLRYWQLDVYYYTGGVDLVPHVPETCAVAGGADYIGTTDLDVPAAPGTPAPWADRSVPFRRALFQQNRTPFVQYYVFSLNGRPENDRKWVRWSLASPFVRHAYFAKIQFAPKPAPPRYVMASPAESDAAARDFATHFLPYVLKALPMPDDVQRLDKAQ